MWLTRCLWRRGSEVDSGGSQKSYLQANFWKCLSFNLRAIFTCGDGSHIPLLRRTTMNHGITRCRKRYGVFTTEKTNFRIQLMWFPHPAVVQNDDGASHDTSQETLWHGVPHRRAHPRIQLTRDSGDAVATAGHTCEACKMPWVDARKPDTL